MYGRDPPPLLRVDNYSSPVDSVDQLLHDRDNMLDDLKMHLWRAQQKMKAVADSGRRDLSFAVGDLVFLKLRPYRQHSLARRPNEKLAPRYYGPYRVDARIGPVAYKLALPSTTSIHSVFHVSQLRPALGMSIVGSDIPPQLTPELELVAAPAAILGVRPRPDTESRAMEVLIQWTGLPVSDATWEAFDRIQHQFPWFHLEDKVRVWAGGNDKPPIRFTYARRKRQE